MPRLVAVLAVLLAAALARGADDALPTPILPLFKAKDKMRYEATHTRIDSSAAGDGGRFRWHFTLEVLSYKGDRLELRYTCHERFYEIEGKPPISISAGTLSAAVSEEIKVLSAVTNVPLDFVVAMDTLAVELPRYDQARARLSRALAFIAQADPLFRGDPLSQKRLLENMEREYTKPAVMTYLTRDFLPLLRPYGNELEPAKPQKTRLLMPTPFGGPVSAEAAGEVVLQVSKDGRNLPLSYELKFEPAAVAALLTDMMARKSNKPADAVARDVDKVNMLMAAQATFLFDARSGWMTQADQTVTWTLDKRSGKDIRTWRPAPPEAEKEKEKEKDKGEKAAPDKK